MSTPIPQPQFEYAFTVRLKLSKPYRLEPHNQGAARLAVFPTEGVIEGPLLQGRVVPLSGGDYPLARPNGVLDFDARYLLEATDGTIIYLQNRGFRWGSDEAMKKMADRVAVSSSEYYMRVSPKFDVAAGPHDWLDRHIFVGIGEKVPEGNAIHYFKML